MASPGACVVMHEAEGTGALVRSALSSPADAILTLQGVRASYDGVVAVLKGVDLSIPQGSIVALLGGNGAGKSTVLKAIAGLVPVSSGSVRLMGDDIQGLRPHWIVMRGIAFAVQGKDVFPSMSVEENLLLGAFSRHDRAEIRIDCERMYAMFPVLKRRSKEPAAILSGGERQMLVIARGLMARPKLLLVDEPSAALAPRIVDEVMAILLDLKRQGLSIMLVEQNVNAALDIADRFFVLRDGKVVIDGDASDRGRFDEIKKTYYGVVMGDAPAGAVPLV
jgi:branched-chain amino acid transport system ATP-binding protein